MNTKNKEILEEGILRAFTNNYEQIIDSAALTDMKELLITTGKLLHTFICVEETKSFHPSITLRPNANTERHGPLWRLHISISPIKLSMTAFDGIAQKFSRNIRKPIAPLNMTELDFANKAKFAFTLQSVNSGTVFTNRTKTNNTINYEIIHRALPDYTLLISGNYVQGKEL